MIGSVGPASAADIKRIQAGAGTRPESETNSASASQSPSQSASESGSTTGSIPDVEAGDLIGTNGIQGIYDEQLRGKPGHTVTLVERKHPSELNPDRVTLSEPVSDQDLFTVAAVNGTPLKLSLDLELQTMVEKRLSNTIRGSFVMIDLATGGVVAAADSGDARATADSAQGHFPPGSTFKLVVSLALLRQGFTPDTPVQCPEPTTVNGMVFRNYSGYPSAKLGTITFADALAESCNTAFIEAATKNLSIEQIQEAAASLGCGVDFSMGNPSFFGSLASTDQPTKFAADAIGQGDVLASPLAMAGVAASVASGKTVVGWMVEGRTAPVTAKPLTQDEAKSLQKMAAGVVSSGTATSLKGILVGAKTGTAEYQSAEGIETHGWMIGYNDKYAVAAFVFTGVSGSGDAGPLVKDILQGNP